MATDAYEILDWDSRFFGFGVARIESRRMSADELGAALDELRRAGVKLVYWPAPNEPEIGALGIRLGGFLADEKTTYAIQLDRSATAAPTPQIVRYRSSVVSEDLQRLAVEGAAWSRFRVDPRFPQALCDALYHAWIEKSVTGELADAVLVWELPTGRLGGMITIGHRGDRGHIGLVAVDSACRGQGVGRQLMQAAHAEFVARGLAACEVVTQGRNQAASRLYESCGYRVERVELMFHLWLDVT